VTHESPFLKIIIYFNKIGIKKRTRKSTRAKLGFCGGETEKGWWRLFDNELIINEKYMYRVKKREFKRADYQ